MTRTSPTKEIRRLFNKLMEVHRADDNYYTSCDRKENTLCVTCEMFEDIFKMKYKNKREVAK